MWKYYAWTGHIFVQLLPENKVNSSESPRNSIWKRKDNNSYMWNSWGTDLTPKGMLTMTSYTFHLWDTCSKLMDMYAALEHIRWCFIKQRSKTGEYTQFHSGKLHNSCYQVTQGRAILPPSGQYKDQLKTFQKRPYFSSHKQFQLETGLMKENTAGKNGGKAQLLWLTTDAN